MLRDAKSDLPSWEEIIKESHCGDNIRKVVDLLLSFPPVSVECERLFSHSKLMQSARRGSLKPESLDDCLQAKLESPSILKFDPDPAINSWFVVSTITY